MSKEPKMTVCRNCGTPIAKNARVCLACGAKKKKPFYKRVWFILLIVIAAIAAKRKNLIGTKWNFVSGCQNRNQMLEGFSEIRRTA